MSPSSNEDGAGSDGAGFDVDGWGLPVTAAELLSDSSDLKRLTECPTTPPEAPYGEEAEAPPLILPLFEDEICVLLRVSEIDALHDEIGRLREIERAHTLLRARYHRLRVAAERAVEVTKSQEVALVALAMSLL